MAASTISNVGYTTWLCMNMAMSHHMLQEPFKNYLRLTVLSQHAVTAFSVLQLARTLGWAADDDEDWDAFLQAHLSLFMAKVSLLFTGMIVLFLWHGRRRQKKTAINNKPMTTWRVLRNLYCHYGTTAVLWWLNNSQHIPEGLRASTNGVLVFWFCCVARHFGVIYDIEGVSFTEFTLAFAALLWVSDGFIVLHHPMR
jgi:ABC-type xylose transport system permease subunit